jgi:DNA-binding transcriptional regulator LsrR (DeoR family)
MKAPFQLIDSGSWLPDLADCKTQSPEDREMREQLHQHRYLLFQHGVTVREIAESEGVGERQIYLSISHCETRLSKAEVMANRNFRNAMVAQRKLAEKYTNTLMDLLDGKAGKNWHQRSKALEHFRRTVGAEAGTGVNLHVTQQMAVLNAHQPRSFEEAIDLVRQRQVQQSGTPESPTSVQINANGF